MTNNTTVLIDAAKKLLAQLPKEGEARRWHHAQQEIRELEAALASYAAPQDKPEGPWHIREELSHSNPQSGDISSDIKSIITDGKAELYTYDGGDLQPIVDALNASECEFRTDEAARHEAFILRHRIEEMQGQVTGKSTGNLQHGITDQQAQIIADNILDTCQCDSWESCKNKVTKENVLACIEREDAAPQESEEDAIDERIKEVTGDKRCPQCGAPVELIDAFDVMGEGDEDRQKIYYTAFKYKPEGTVTGKSAGVWKIDDIVYSKSKYTEGKVGKAWKVTDEAVHVRFGEGEEAMFEVFRFETYHHKQSSISELRNINWLDESGEAGKLPEQRIKTRRLFEAIPVEKELPPVQNRSYSRPIIVICTNLLSSVSHEQLKEAKFISQYKDNTEPYFDFGDPNHHPYSKDEVTHWLREQPEQQPADPWVRANNPPKEGGRYWCLVEEVNDLGISRFQWNCYYNPRSNTWSDNFKSMCVTHWTNLLPFPGSAQSDVSGEQPADLWIPVTTALPKDEKENEVYCLVIDTYWGMVVRPYNQAHNCWDMEDGDDYYTDAVGGKITHWMPLPKGPKAGEQKGGGHD